MIQNCFTLKWCHTRTPAFLSFSFILQKRI